MTAVRLDWVWTLRFLIDLGGFILNQTANPWSDQKRWPWSRLNWLNHDLVHVQCKGMILKGSDLHTNDRKSQQYTWKKENQRRLTVNKTKWAREAQKNIETSHFFYQEDERGRIQQDGRTIKTVADHQATKHGISNSLTSEPRLPTNQLMSSRETHKPCTRWQ